MSEHTTGPDPTICGGRVGWVAGPDGLVELRVSAAVSAAYDILTDDGYPPEKAAEVVVNAERAGYDPETIARKMVTLRKAIR